MMQRAKCERSRWGIVRSRENAKADSFFAGEAIFANDELGSQSGIFLPAKEYFFQ